LIRSQEMPGGRDEILRRPVDGRNCRIVARVSGDGPARLEAGETMAAARVECKTSSMTGERRQQIEDIVAGMLMLGASERAARLDSACANDSELRREVESLLAQESLADRFLETPALEAAARALARDQSDVLIGRSVGPYRIDKLLAVGGMGEVYYGWDPRLPPPAALQFLPR